MKNDVIKILGQEKIDQICRKFGLDEEGKKKVLEIIDKWEEIVKTAGLGAIDEKMHAAIEILGNDPNRMAIIRALIHINAEFMTQRLEIQTVAS